jgi:hypothetical protein
MKTDRRKVVGKTMMPEPAPPKQIDSRLALAKSELMKRRIHRRVERLKPL